MSTKIKTMRGLFYSSSTANSAPVVCRFTSDHLGETLSLEANGIMITVAFEQIQKVIESARKER